MLNKMKSESTINQNLWAANTSKAVLRGKCIALSAYIGKEMVSNDDVGYKLLKTRKSKLNPKKADKKK